MNIYDDHFPPDWLIIILFVLGVLTAIGGTACLIYHLVW